MPNVFLIPFENYTLSETLIMLVFLAVCVVGGIFLFKGGTNSWR